MGTETWTMPVLLNVGSYCAPADLLTGLGLTSKSLHVKILSLLAPLLREYIVNGAALQSNSAIQLQLLLSTSSHLLQFLPLYYDGGLSTREMQTSFEAMWEFSGVNYSTYYTEGSGDLVGNKLAVGYFSGLPGANLMSEKFHFDANVLKGMPEQIDEELQTVLKADLLAAITLDFLTPNYSVNSKMLMTAADWNHRLHQVVNQTQEVPVLERYYPYTPKGPGLALVREVCVARPFNYTGPVKTLLIVAGRLDGNALSPRAYKQWEGVDTYEKAVQVGSGRLRRLEGVEVLEYAYQQGDYWPLLWVNFPDIGHNHVRVPLQRPQCFRTAAVLLSSIEDRRAIARTSTLQPNFDIMFTVFLGSISVP